MTEEEIDELLQDCPNLFHMAESGSWNSIQEHGLMSTSALLDQYEIEGEKRKKIESCHRPESIQIEAENLPGAVVRDQIPMTDNGLKRCLPNHLQPADWYSILNSKVFFWLTRERLHKLTGARAYREKNHDVLEINTQSLIEAHRERIWFCPINSGCTKPFPHPRDENTFQRITDYPYSSWRKKRRSGERIVELCVDYSIPDIEDHVQRVVSMRGDQILKTIASHH